MTKTRLSLWIILLLCIAHFACRKAETGRRPLTENDITALRVATRQYRDAEAATDWAAVTVLYTEDAIRMLPNRPTIQGRHAILQEFQARPYTVVEYDQRIEEVDGYGGFAVVRGVFSYAVDTDGRVSDGTGKYIAVYRRQTDGNWLIDRDIFNLDEPSR